MLIFYAPHAPPRGLQQWLPRKSPLSFRPRPRSLLGARPGHNQMVSSPRAGGGPLSPTQRLEGRLLNKFVQRRKKEEREENGERIATFPEGRRERLQRFPPLGHGLRSKSKPAPACGRGWRTDKAWRTTRSKRVNGERKVERNPPLHPGDFTVELSAAGCHGDRQARTAAAHWLRGQSQ